jgi:hypothetical protein
MLLLFVWYKPRLKLHDSLKVLNIDYMLIVKLIDENLLETD